MKCLLGPHQNKSFISLWNFAWADTVRLNSSSNLYSNRTFQSFIPFHQTSKWCAARMGRPNPGSQNRLRPPEPLNPVAPNVPSKLLLLTPHPHPHHDHTPMGLRDYLSKPSAGFKGGKKIRKCEVWFKSARCSKNSIYLHLS